MFCTVGLNTLPFEPVRGQVIYSEGRYNPVVNAFIERNYDRLRDYFAKRKLDFCYIPRIQKELSDNSAIKDYYSPYKKKAVLSKPLGNDLVLRYMTRPENKEKVPPVLLFYSDFAVGDDCEDIFQLRGAIIEVPKGEVDDTTIDEILSREFQEAAREINGQFFSIHFMKVRSDYAEEQKQPSSDKEFDYEAKKLISEIEERIEKLHQKGINSEILNRILRSSNKLSRMFIGRDFHIQLPDYDMEIKMPPLPKAIYILFLRHPEGIQFKFLPDYRPELSEIYEQLRHGALSERERQSVIDVTDPLKNSINEKCARIREAFVSKFDERLACRYYIDGKRGEPKKVSLPQELIKWE